MDLVGNLIVDVVACLSAAAVCWLVEAACSQQDEERDWVGRGRDGWAKSR
jgi:hypothetical protein